MHIAHSNISVPVFGDQPIKRIKEMTAEERFAYDMAYKGFKQACKKNEARLAEIREFFPDYEPKFNYPTK